METKATVLIVDDEPMTCQLVKRVLEEAGFLVVDIAHDGDTAVKLVPETEPDVVLLDLTMPGNTDGMSALRVIKSNNPSVKVLVLTGHKEPRLVREAIHRGASGFINKTDIYTNLPHTIENLLQGDIAIVDPELMRQALQEAPQRWMELSKKEDLISDLTPREKTVLGLIAKGFDNQMIAQQLFISYNTVKSHTRSIFDKLSVADRTQAALIALEAGLDDGTNGSSSERAKS